MNLIDEPLLATVRSIENADQDNDSQEVINNLKLEYMSGEYKSVPLFWNGSLKLNGKDNFIL